MPVEIIRTGGINCGFLLPTPTPPRRGIPLLGGVGVGSDKSSNYDAFEHTFNPHHNTISVYKHNQSFAYVKSLSFSKARSL